MNAEETLVSYIGEKTDMVNVHPTKDEILLAMKEYARGKCMEQRLSCRNAFYEQVKKDDGKDLAEAYKVIENALEPPFD